MVDRRDPFFLLDEFHDVSVAGAKDGAILTFDGANWTPQVSHYWLGGYSEGSTGSANATTWTAVGPTVGIGKVLDSTQLVVQGSFTGVPDVVPATFVFGVGLDGAPVDVTDERTVGNRTWDSATTACVLALGRLLGVARGSYTAQLYVRRTSPAASTLSWDSAFDWHALHIWEVT